MRIFVFVVSFVLFLASCYAMSAAFQFGDDVTFIVPGGAAVLLFIAGILGASLSFAIPFSLLKKSKI